VNDVLPLLKNKKFSAVDYVKFYSKIALETFQYGAESGSIIAFEWAFVLLAEMNEHLNDSCWQDQYIILVHIGFAFYNYAQDVRYRYGMVKMEKFRSFKLYDRTA